MKKLIEELIVKVFCPSCGELEIKKSEIQHPAQDAISRKIIESGCGIHYIGKEQNPTFNPPIP